MNSVLLKILPLSVASVFAISGAYLAYAEASQWRENRQPSLTTPSSTTPSGSQAQHSPVQPARNESTTPEPEPPTITTDAPSERYPTEAELSDLNTDFEYQIEEWHQYPEPEQRHTARDVATSWAAVDPAIAPFLGKWGAFEESMEIYPTQTPGQVCVLYLYGIDAYARLSTGTVSNGKLYTTWGEVLMRESDHLGVAWVNQGGTNIHVYRLLEAAEASTSGFLRGVDYWQGGSQLQQEFQASGCISEPRAVASTLVKAEPKSEAASSSVVEVASQPSVNSATASAETTTLSKQENSSTESMAVVATVEPSSEVDQTVQETGSVSSQPATSNRESVDLNEKITATPKQPAVDTKTQGTRSPKALSSLTTIPKSGSTVEGSTMGLQTVETGWFSIQYPLGWVMDSSSQDFMSLRNFDSGSGGGLAPVEAIKTDITLLPESFDNLVNPNRPAPVGEEDTIVLKRELLQIHGREAMRLWLETPAFDFSHGIVTYIQYSDQQTVSIASYYSAENPDAESLIQQIHQSLTVTSQ